MKTNNFVFYGILITLVVIFLASAVIFKVFNIEILPSQFYGALIGVFITAIVTAFLLRGQTEGEVQKDKNIKIYEQKIPVFSEFVSKIWKMVYDVESNTKELEKKYDEVKLFCFDKLVFFLKQDETEKLAEIIEKIDTTKPIDYNLPHICKITNILQSSLENKHENASYLKKLYDAFDNKDINPQKETNHTTVAIKDNNINYANITFWHFTMLDDTQLKALKEGNWLLSLIEYDDEEWRTNLLKQVRENDVVFLFRRGGYGYIGAFRAKGIKVLTKDDWNGKDEHFQQENACYDMYDALDDGASFVSNILVEPLAYNYNGVGYLTVRRRTIERINDMEAVKFLLNRFNGKDLDENQLTGKGKLDSETPVELNDNYFSGIVNNNL